jgi:spoIIIJ-associated protein
MDKLQIVETEAKDLLNVDIEVTEDHGLFHILIKTETEAPVVIGRHGETIKAIQKILEVVMYKKVGESVELLVNVNDYREKQTERLAEIADRSAQKALEFKAASYIRGLSAYERKVIHEYITNKYPELASYSTGEGRDRRLVVDMKENVPAEEAKS